MSWAPWATTEWWVLLGAFVLGAVLSAPLVARLSGVGYRREAEADRALHSPGWIHVVLPLVFAALAGRLGTTAYGLLWLSFAGLAVIGVALTHFDLDVHRLPRPLTRASIGVSVLGLGATSAVLGDVTSWRRGLIAAVVVWAIFGLLALLAAALKSGFGLGDVALAPTIGMASGWLSGLGPVVAGYAAFIFAGVFAGIAVLSKRATRKTSIAFGPFMLAGLLASVFIAAHPLG